ARTPATGLVAHRDALDRDTDHGGVTAGCSVPIAPRFACEKIAHAAREMYALARDAQHRLHARLDPDRAAHGAMFDAMRHAAQRQLQDVGEWNGLPQPLQARRDPPAVAFREGARLLHAAAQRHGEHDGAARCLHAQCIAPCLAVTAQLDGVDGAVERDLDQLRIGRPAEQKRAQRHRAVSNKNHAQYISDVIPAERSKSRDPYFRSHRPMHEAKWIPDSRFAASGMTTAQAPASALRLLPLPWPLCVSAKSEMRGAI